MKFVQRIEIPASVTKMINKTALRIDPNAKIHSTIDTARDVLRGRFGTSITTAKVYGDDTIVLEAVVDLNEIVVVKIMSGIYKVVDGAMDIHAVVTDLSEDETLEVTQEVSEDFDLQYQQVG